MDKIYWENYYKTHLQNAAPSLFAKFVWENYLANLKKNSRQSATACHVEQSETSPLSKTATQNSRQSAATCRVKRSETSAIIKKRLDSSPTAQNDKIRLIELGCGNGRDSLYFAKCDLSVLGVDQCENVVEFLNAHFKSENLRFLSGDFTALADFEERFDAVYSRFTLHSITQTQQDKLFAWIVRNLKSGGVLAIEARGLKNSLFQKGEAVPNEPNAFIYENHYRRFVDIAALCEALKRLNFSLNFAKEEQNFAPFKDENDYFFRIIATFGG